MKRRILLASLVAGVTVLAAAWFMRPRIEAYLYRQRVDRENAETMKAITSKDVITQQLLDSIRQSAVKPIVPERAYLAVPSFCQSPYPTEDSWKFHKESCEEAAALQAVYYWRGVSDVQPAEVDRTLRDMVNWQENHFGEHKDIHADSVKMLLVGYFGYRPEEIRILRKATILDIKQHVAQGYPVIAPTYGRALKNPYYTPPGPEYHMVTVIGYTRDRIITNDVGTKRGKDYTYDLETFRKAMEMEGGDCLVIIPTERASAVPTQERRFQ